MAWFIGQSLLIVLTAFFLGLLVGWFVWGRRKSSPPSDDNSAAPPEKGADALVAPRAPLTGTRKAEVRRTHAEAVPQDNRPTIERDAVSQGARPTIEDDAASAASEDSVEDDLERIEGIGPKMAAALRAAGIHSFGQLAATDDDTRRSAIEAAGLTFAPSLVSWGRQAQLLADGDEDAFLELTQRLVAGRDPEGVR